MHNQFPIELARSIAVAMVGKRASIFSRPSQFDKDDLVQECMLTAMRSWTRYDGRLVKPGTWLYKVMSDRLIDLQRVHIRGRRVKPDCDIEAVSRNSDHKIIDCDIEAVSRNSDHEIIERVPEAMLESWMTSVYAACRKAYRQNWKKHGRKWFSPSQVAALGILSKTQNLSRRGLRRYVADRPILMRILRMRHLPSCTWFNNATRFRDINLRDLLSRTRHS